MTQDCKKYQAQFSEFIDRELRPEECAEIEKHLEQCPECQKELRMLQLTATSVQKLKNPPAPQDFLVKLRQKIASSEKPVSVGLFQRANHWLLQHPVMIAAGFVVVFTGAFILGRFSPSVSVKEDKLASEMEPVQAWEGGFAPAALIHPVSSSGAFYERVPSEKSGSVRVSVPVAPSAPALAVGLGSDSEIMSYSRSPKLKPVSLAEEKALAKDQDLGQLFLQTPTQLVIYLLRRDPAFEGAKIYPIAHGALAQTSDSVFRITISEHNFIQALKWIADKKEMPKSILEAQKVFGLEIEKLPNPLKPAE